MITKKFIEDMIREVARGTSSKRVLDEYIDKATELSNKEQDIVDALMSSYPELTARDAGLFDSIMDKYHDGDGYAISSVVQDLLQLEISDDFKFVINNIAEEHGLKLSDW